MILSINIEDSFGINEIIEQLPKINDLSNEIIKIDLKYKCGNFLKGEIFAIITAYIHYLRENDKNVELIYDPDEECETIKYAARINFFQNIGVDFEEKFQRNSSVGRFIEITEFNDKNLFDIVFSLAQIFKKQLNLNKGVLNSINYCLGEVVDNVDTHSGSKNGGIIYAQYFSSTQKLKIFIVDTGMGFYKSLTNNKEYKDMSEEEVIMKSIEKEVTSGKGQGMGLFHTCLFTIANKGSLIINTCGKELYKNMANQKVIDVPFWQGSIICLELRTNVDVDYSIIFEGYEPATLEESEENRSDQNNEENQKITKLW